MVELIFYGGVGEIGGNKILLQDEGTRVFLDFGLCFSRRGKFFEEFLTPRTANGIGDFLAMNLIPDIKGVYREDLLIHLGRKPEEPEIDAILLSHAHADHANYISFIHKDIPVYCGYACKSVLDAVNEQSRRDIENEVVDFKLRPIYPWKAREPPIKRKFKLFRTGDSFTVGSIDVEPIHVDHSVPGSYGFIIYTSKGAIVYTGDLRMHGINPRLTEDFIEKAKEAKPVAVITEGTHIDRGKSDESEKKVYEKSKKVLEKVKGKLSIVDFNFKDVDRFRTFYRISKEIDKFLVISFKHACFLDEYHKHKDLAVPDCRGENILLLKPKLLTGTYSDFDYRDAYIKKRLSYPNVITAEEIANRPEDYIVVLNFWYFNTLIDLKPDGGVYIHSLSEPFNEEMQISFDRMMNWLEFFNLKFVQAHCSGHINGYDLKKMIKEINPKILYPIHTEKPEMFRDIPVKTVIVKEEESYKVTEHG